MIEFILRLKYKALFTQINYCKANYCENYYFIMMITSIKLDSFQAAVAGCLLLSGTPRLGAQICQEACRSLPCTAPLVLGVQPAVIWLEDLHSFLRL